MCFYSFGRNSNFNTDERCGFHTINAINRKYNLIYLTYDGKVVTNEVIVHE